jgi:hypothetical protein
MSVQPEGDTPTGFPVRAVATDPGATRCDAVEPESNLAREPSMPTTDDL